MSEDSTAVVLAGAAPTSAGALLRRLREERGVDLDILASALKVPSRKLQLLEADAHQALPGMAFVRSLALAVCRQLNVDPQPVLGLLPAATTVHGELEHVTRGLAAPFREAGTQSDGLFSLSTLLRIPVMVPVALVVAALLFWFAPQLRVWSTDLVDKVSAMAPAATTGGSTAPATPALSATGADGGAVRTSAPDASAASASAAEAALPASAVVETVFSAPVEDPAASVAAKPAAAGSLVLRTTSASWVEVSDAANKVLLARMLTPGETVGLDGALPMRAKIGNAAGTEVSFRGQRIDLAPVTRENVARLELK
jgi:cytoskeleton protein RodZ